MVTCPSTNQAQCRVWQTMLPLCQTANCDDEGCVGAELSWCDELGVCSVAVPETDACSALPNDCDVHHLRHVGRTALEHLSQTVRLLLQSALTAGRHHGTHTHHHLHLSDHFRVHLEYWNLTGHDGGCWIRCRIYIWNNLCDMTHQSLSKATVVRLRQHSEWMPDYLTGVNTLRLFCILVGDTLKLCTMRQQSWLTVARQRIVTWKCAEIVESRIYWQLCISICIVCALQTSAAVCYNRGGG